MIELCDACGAVQGPGGECACGGVGVGPPLALDLDLDRPRTVAPPAISVAPSRMAPSLPLPLPPPPWLPPSGSRPLPPQSLGGTPKLVAILGAMALFFVGLWLGVRALRGWGEDQVNQAATRPYPAPNRLVIAAVTSDYGSSVTGDGSVLLEKTPRGPAAGLAGFYAADTTRATGAVEKAIAALPGASYRALEAPAGPCRSDAETSVSTLGEISIGEQTITVFTCVLTKKSHAYFLAWAAASVDLDAERRHLDAMLKSSQLVSNNLCAVNVINGGCSPSASSLVTTLVASARR